MMPLGLRIVPCERLLAMHASRRLQRHDHAHVFDWPADSRLVIPLRNAQVKKAYMLADEGKRSLAVRAGAEQSPHR